MTECPICQSATEPVGEKFGEWSKKTFFVKRCPNCAFNYVSNPSTDFAHIYGDDYYAGRGADPLVDYVFEMEHRDTTIRRYEWRGIVDAAGRSKPLDDSMRWLDYGCGTGGLVSYLKENTAVDGVGFEEGWSVPRLRELKVPVLDRDEMEAQAGSFDVVSAIEVIEHVPDPVPELKRMARLLRPGSLLFLTTGNSAPHAKDMLNWPYLIPEIHVSLFEPRTLAIALERAGLVPEFPGFGPGWTDIVRFKALKNLHRTKSSQFERVVPWSLVSRALDRKYALSAHPIGHASG